MKTRLFLLSIFLSTTAAALEVTPGYQVIETSRSGQGRGELTIRNDGNEAYEITPQRKDWLKRDENAGLTASEWLNVEDRPFVLKPGGEKRVRVTVAVPGTVDREVMGMVSFLAKPLHPSQLNLRVSVAVYAVPRERARFRGHIAQLDIRPDRAGGTRADVTVRNDGNVHVRAKGLVKIYSLDDKLLGRIDVGPGMPIFPGREGQYSGRDAALTLAPGRYSADLLLVDMNRRGEMRLERQEFRVPAGADGGRR